MEAEEETITVTWKKGMTFYDLRDLVYLAAYEAYSKNKVHASKGLGVSRRGFCNVYKDAIARAEIRKKQNGRNFG